MSPRFARALLAAHAIGLGFAGAASATTTLFTPPGTVPAGKYAYCDLVNVGTTPMQVTTNSVIQTGSGTEVTVFNGCTGTLAPGKMCESLYIANKLDSVYCHFVVSSSKVRGALTVIDQNGEPCVNLPATK